MIKKIIFLVTLISNGASLYGMLWQTDQEFYQDLQTLVSSGVNINQPMQTSFDPSSTLLHEVVRRGELYRAWCLLNNGARVDVYDSIRQTPLHRATRMRHLEMVKLLVEHEASLDVKDHEHHTPLYYACNGIIDENALAVADMLIEAGADVDAEDGDGATPLQHVVLASQKSKGMVLAMARLLVDAGANILKLDNDGNTALHLAPSRSGLDVIEFLFRKVNNPHVCDGQGNTLLHKACAARDMKKIAFLLFHSADITLKNDDGQTPLMELLQGDLLMRKEENPSGISLATLVKLWCMDSRTESDATDIYGNTLLHHAAYHDTSCSCELLAPVLRMTKHLVNVANNKGRTPLHAAVINGNITTPFMLLQAGANITARDNEGLTPLGCLIGAKKLNRLTKFILARQLMFHGSNVNPHPLKCNDNEVVFLGDLSEESLQQCGIDRDFIRDVMSKEYFDDCRRDVIDSLRAHHHIAPQSPVNMSALRRREITGKGLFCYNNRW